MTDGRTAEARLERLLHVLPAAGREGGASLSELAAALGTSRERILEDLDQLTGRVYYHPGGWPDDVRILLGPDRVQVIHAAGFKRPRRLSARETLCLALALRGTAASSHIADPEGREALLKRAESRLATSRMPDATGEGGSARPSEPTRPPKPPFAVADYTPDESEHRETLLRAARERVACGIMYLKPGARDAEGRLIHPYALVHAEGWWYAVAHCCVRDDVRAFRVDRVLEASPSDTTFDVPEGFDASRYVKGGRVYATDQDIEVRVRYSRRIAPWIRERAAVGMISMTEEPDGSIVLSHRVADPHWVVTQVLQYGAEAEVLEPDDLRGMVRDVALRLA